MRRQFQMFFCHCADNQWRDAMILGYKAMHYAKVIWKEFYRETLPIDAAP